MGPGREGGQPEVRAECGNPPLSHVLQPPGKFLAVSYLVKCWVPGNGAAGEAITGEMETQRGCERGAGRGGEGTWGPAGIPGKPEPGDPGLHPLSWGL